MWKGDLRFTTPMLFSIGFIAMFVIGGLSGVTHAIVPSDYQQTDTYYIVAHFHYVLFGGAIFGLFGGHVLLVAEGLRPPAQREGRAGDFWLMLIGFNMTFGPMHILGLQGMPRRIQSYPASLGLDVLEPGLDDRRVPDRDQRARVPGQRDPHAAEARRDGATDPWDARTLEWTTSSPPPEYNFDEIPACTRSTSSGTASTPRPAAAASCPCRPAARARADEGQRGRRARDPHAVPVVLPADRRPRAADHRLRPDLLGWLVAVGACVIAWSGSTAGSWSPRSEEQRWRTSRCSGRTSGGRARDQHGPAAHQARDVAVPGVGLPAVRRADLRPTCSTGARA